MLALCLFLATTGPGISTAAATASASRPSLALGDPLPGFRLPVENPARWGAPSVDLRDLRGSGTRLVVTFGASWCAPCKRELAALRKEAAALEARGARVVVVVADESAEGRGAMMRWLVEELDVPFAVVVDELGLLRRRHHAEELPAAFVAGGDGRISWARTGYTEGGVQELLAALSRAGGASP